MIATQFTGYLGRDPEIKKSNTTSKEYVQICVGVNMPNKNTVWANVMIFDKQGEYLLQHAKKGVKVFVAGRPDISAYVNKNTGNPVPTLTMLNATVEIIDKVESKEVGHFEARALQSDDIPF